MALSTKDFQPEANVADDEKKVEITLLTDCRIDNDTIGNYGETHKVGVGTGAMLVGHGLAVDGKQKVPPRVVAEPEKSAAEKKLAAENEELREKLAAAEKRGR